MDRFGLDSQIITLRPLPGHATMGANTAETLEAGGRNLVKGAIKPFTDAVATGEAIIKKGEDALKKAAKGDIGGAGVDLLNEAAKNSGDPVTAFFAGAYSSAYETQKKIEKQVVNFLDDVQKGAVGLVKDLFDENVCENGQDKAGKALNASYDRIMNLLGYTGSNASICAFRLGEAVAKATSRVAEQGWVYARYVENGKVPEGIRNAAGTKDRVRRGFKDRWKNFPGKGEVGPCGLRNIIGHALKTSIALEKTLEVSKNVDDRRLVFLGFLCKWLPGGRFDAKTGKATHGWCLGMDFLIKDALKAPSLMSYLTTTEASGLTGISQDTAKEVADDNIKKQEEAARRAQEADRKAKADAQIAKLNNTRLASDQQRAAIDQQIAEYKQRAAKNPQPKAQNKAAAGIIALAAVAAGVYLMTKS
jgi:hypothetical protein